MTSFTEILVPVDYSECSDAALRLAAGLARAVGGRLLVLHVLPINMASLLGDFPTPAAKPNRDAAEHDRLELYVRSVLEGFEPAPAYEVDVFWGVPRLDIVPEAVQRRADLIVVGTHGRTGLKHVLLGSVAERIVRTAHCPVLTVRGTAAAELKPGATRTEREARPRVRAGQVLMRMTPRPVTVSPDDHLAAARARMTSYGVRHLPVVDGSRLVGILSDRDLAAHLGHLDHSRVNAAMTPNPVTVASDVDIDTAAELMIGRKVRALPVVDGERVIGIVSSDDILEDYVRAARR